MEEQKTVIPNETSAPKAPEETAPKKKKKRALPHALVIIMAIIVLVTALTWIIPGGVYLQQDANGVWQGTDGFDAATGTKVYNQQAYFPMGET